MAFIIEQESVANNKIKLQGDQHAHCTLDRLFNDHLSEVQLSVDQILFKKKNNKLIKKKKIKNLLNQDYLNVSLVEQENTLVLSGDQCTKFNVPELMLRNGTQVSKG